MSRILVCLMLVGIWSGAGWAQDQGEATAEPEASSEAAFDAKAEAGKAAASGDDLALYLIPLTADELSELAVTWQSHLRTQVEALMQTNLALKSASNAQEATLRSEFNAQSDALLTTLEKYRQVIDAWALKGGAEEDVATYRSYADALATSTLQTTDLKTLFFKGIDWLISVDGGLGLLGMIIAVLVAIWAMMFLSRLIRNMTRRGLDRVPNLSRLLKTFIVTAVYWAVFVLGILVVLGLFGVNVTPLFAVFGGLSFILGFALQETLGNLASGLMIMILKPFDTGDYIQVGGSSGFVDDMSVVSTRIRTFDNQIVVVPNSKIWGDVITNVSASEERRVDLVFGIAYSDSAPHAIEVLKGLVEAHKMCLTDPPPEIFVGELGDNSVNIFCRPWCKSDDYWTVYWDLTGQAKETFDAEGISIPFPQRDVHLIPVTEAQE
ncbi:MAG: mechanosensitive ion channel [Rhodobacteraceae bacterium]|nr:mechanosensitive ion channel [Paracoccaceae bacterium]